jgi:5-formyltetrahydrofolate cyclo-ligase
VKDKRGIRKEMKARLEAQSGDDRRRKSLAIGEKLFALEAFRAAKCVAFYVAMPHEVDTAPMIDRALAAGMRVTVPRCDMETVELTLYEIRNRSNLQRGTWGIYEPDPHPAHVVHPENVSVVIVPGVAFDLTGNRIGNAKGFYDRFLKRVPPGALKIGLAYGLQILPSVPVEAHDVKLDMVLTD